MKWVGNATGALLAAALLLCVASVSAQEKPDLELGAVYRTYLVLKRCTEVGQVRRAVLEEGKLAAAAKEKAFMPNLPANVKAESIWAAASKSVDDGFKTIQSMDFKDSQQFMAWECSKAEEFLLKEANGYTRSAPKKDF